MVTPHPAKFSDSIMEVIADIIPGREQLRVLDPFAGVGRVHELATETVDTWGVEIEPEWATMHPRTIVGDATRLPFRDGAFDYVVTSPTYGNRMADHHDAKERCRVCEGSGDEIYHPPLGGPPERQACVKCNGRGFREYKRMTYRHQLGRPLHPNNSGAMQWGERYRQLHMLAWGEAWRVMKPDGKFVLNVKNHIRGKVEQDVHGWHCDVLHAMGFEAIWTEMVLVPNMGFGANAEARTEGEYVTVLRRQG